MKNNVTETYINNLLLSLLIPYHSTLLNYHSSFGPASRLSPKSAFIEISDYHSDFSMIHLTHDQSTRLSEPTLPSCKALPDHGTRRAQTVWENNACPYICERDQIYLILVLYITGGNKKNLFIFKEKLTSPCFQKQKAGGYEGLGC